MNGRHTGARRAAMRLIAAMVASASMLAWGQGFPSRPVKLIVPSAPGDGSDIMARLLAQKLQERWGQPVTVENRPGAGGVVGTDAAAKAAGDGYTVIVGNAGSHAINQALYPKLPYDVTQDFTAVTMLASAPNAFVVNPAVPARTVAEFIALAKSEPGKYAFASGGNGSSAHLNGEMLNMMAGIRTTHVPYKGASPAITDVMGGQVQLMIGNLPPMLPHIRSGKLRLLGVTTPRRFCGRRRCAPDRGHCARIRIAGLVRDLRPGGNPEGCRREMACRHGGRACHGRRAGTHRRAGL
jgi:tripartite-type tricarboxylate transporter receptor subunit TctC